VCDAVSLICCPTSEAFSFVASHVACAALAVPVGILLANVSLAFSSVCDAVSLIC